MKAQVIRSKNKIDFCEEINSFIKGKKVVDIKYATTFAITAYRGGIPYRQNFYDSALILYEEE